MVLLQRCQEPDLSRVRVRHVKITWVVLSQILKMSLQEKQIPYDIIYMWNLKYGTNEPTYKTETDLQTRRTALWLPRGKREGVGYPGNLGFVDENELHLEWISNEDLLYSTGNYIQSLGRDYDGR